MDTVGGVVRSTRPAMGDYRARSTATPTQQCMGRWRRHVDPCVARGNWTLEEDEKLTKEHETLGAKWAVIAREIEGRTAQQCRARFTS